MLEPIGGALVYCFAVLALAGFVQGVFGMGFAMIATPLLAMVVDYSSAIYLAAVPLWVIASVFLLLERKRAFAEPLCLRLVPGIIAGSVIGVMLQTALPQRLSLALLGFLLIFGALVPTLLQWLKMAPRTMRARSVATFGASAGITEAALNVGAPFMVLLPLVVLRYSSAQFARPDRQTKSVLIKHQLVGHAAGFVQKYAPRPVPVLSAAARCVAPAPDQHQG